MATKTVVCPECGAGAERGRYACGECGALLAAVAAAPREYPGRDEGAAPTEEPGAEALVQVTDAEPRAAAPSIDRLEAGPADGIALEDDLGPAPTPAWPPAGDRGPDFLPPPRTPAGSWLPPSAVLPPLDGATAVAALAGPSATDRVAGAGRSARLSIGRAAAAALGRAAAARGPGFAASSGSLATVPVAGDLARRMIGVGSALAAVGILLPWVNGPAGTSPLTGYVERWGLAGPGMWLVLFALVGLGLAALSAARPASWPIGLPAIVVASFLVGLLWPELIGGFGRAIGIWFVLVGAFVLGAGGVLDRGPRRGKPAQPV